jgi:hypothetical protein
MLGIPGIRIAVTCQNRHDLSISSLTLVGNIGADRASYATLLFPIIALIISTLIEGYQWTTPAVAGVAIILAGNALSLAKFHVPAFRARLALKINRRSQQNR